MRCIDGEPLGVRCATVGGELPQRPCFTKLSMADILKLLQVLCGGLDIVASYLSNYLGLGKALNAQGMVSAEEWMGSMCHIASHRSDIDGSVHRSSGPPSSNYRLGDEAARPALR